MLVVLMAIGSLYLGVAFPDGAFAAVVLGWGVAAAVHLAFGSPGGRPTRAQVAAALGELGVPAHEVELARPQPRSGTLMLARDDDGPLHVRVLGRDEADAQFMAKLWRFLLYKDGGPRLYLTRLEDVEHEAYTLLLAARGGVHVPDVVVTGTAGPGAALLVDRRPVGTVSPTSIRRKSPTRCSTTCGNRPPACAPATSRTARSTATTSCSRPRAPPSSTSPKRRPRARSGKPPTSPSSS